VVDLTPSGFDTSVAEGAGGGQQAGFGSGPATGSHDHALLWTGSATSVVNLHPSGFTDSRAQGGITAAYMKLQHRPLAKRMRDDLRAASLLEEKSLEENWWSGSPCDDAAENAGCTVAGLRTRCPKNFLTCCTARSLMVGFP
jgi:hypothetical protein